MAKDGTRRGGARAGAGRKPKALTDKINEGESAKILEFPTSISLTPVHLTGEDMPPVKEYLMAKQQDGRQLCAEEVYRETWKCLRERDCDQFINIQLVEQYALSVARWIQCEECISQFGLLAQHPTTGSAIASPYVSMAQNYMKQTNQIWYQIYQVVKENCSTDYSGATPQDDIMERLLKSRKGS